MLGGGGVDTMPLVIRPPTAPLTRPQQHFAARDEQALVSLTLKKYVDAEGGRTIAVIIEGG